jgi:SpoVK/Ycf46/Vps4 family AAA+-type ATPase
MQSRQQQQQQQRHRIESNGNEAAPSSVFTKLGAPYMDDVMGHQLDRGTATSASSSAIGDDRANAPTSSSSRVERLLHECTTTLLQSHDKAIVDTVMRDVVQRDLGVSFDDIASLDTAKRLLNEAVVLPLIMPEFFTGIREPWKVREGLIEWSLFSSHKNQVSVITFN